jgi:hypothetical protein
MMTPIIPRFTSPPRYACDPQLQVRAAGSEYRTLARSRFIFNLTTQRADALHP